MEKTTPEKQSITHVDFINLYKDATTLDGLLKKLKGWEQKDIDGRISFLRSKKIPLKTLRQRGFVESQRGQTLDVKALTSLLEGSKALASDVEMIKRAKKT